MRKSIIIVVRAAGHGPRRIIGAALATGVELDAAVHVVWLPLADLENDIDGTPLRANQTTAREGDLVAWAVGRIAELGDVAAGRGSSADATGLGPGDGPAGGSARNNSRRAATGCRSVVVIADAYRAPARSSPAHCDWTVAQRTARRAQRRRRLAWEPRQSWFRGFGSQAGNFRQAGPV